MEIKYSSNAFWTNWKRGGEDKSSITAIRTTTYDDGKIQRDQVEVSQKDGDKDNVEYHQIIAQIGEEALTKNTLERRERKEAEQKQHELIAEQRRKSRMLEELFALKLQAFETEIIKNSKNRKMRSNIRRSSNPVEMQAYVTLLYAMELGLIKDGNED